MNKPFVSFALLGLLLGSPVYGQDPAPAADDTPAAEDTAKPTPAELKAEKLKKKSESLKVKWYNNEKKAFKDAKKYNLPVWVLYSDPSSCAMCQALDKNIINSRQFKNAKGLFIGFRTTSPLPKYGCDKGMPMGALVEPNGTKICNLSYNPAMTPEKYIEQITNARNSGDTDEYARLMRICLPVQKQYLKLCAEQEKRVQLADSTDPLTEFNKAV